MNCNEFERSLENLVESHRGTLAPEAERHRAGCAACAALWQDHQRLDVAVQAWRRDVPTIDLTSRVLEELQPTTVPARPVRSPPGSRGSVGFGRRGDVAGCPLAELAAGAACGLGCRRAGRDAGCC